MKVLYEGGPEMAIGFMKWIGAGYYIDAADCGKIHLIGKGSVQKSIVSANITLLVAAVDPSVENERIFGHAGEFSFDDMLEVLRKHLPKKKLMDNFGQKPDPGTVPTERGDELLKNYYGTGWTDFEECVIANLKSLIKLE